MNHTLPLQEFVGWGAAVLTLLAFLCTNIVRLRYVALAANAAFITYGLTAELWPVLALHCVLVPVNLWRLLQTRRLSPQGLIRMPAFITAGRDGVSSRPPDAPRTRHTAAARWMGCIVVAVVAVVAGSFPGGGSGSLASPGVPVAAQRPSHPTERAFDAPAALDMRAFALNALLAPLIDDSLAGRWTEVGLDFFCDPDTRVLVDGQPMVAGSAVPERAFTVRWDMGQCQPLGSGITLSGRVDLLVTHHNGGLSAVVAPDGLRLDSPEGRLSLHAPFTATLSSGTSPVQRPPGGAR